MNMNPKFVYLVRTAIFSIAWACFVVPATHADTINVLVPAYGNPCCDGGPNMWSQLLTTAASPNRNFALHVIFNPASGPGTVREPNYLNSSGVGPLAAVRNAGAVIHGYVATSYGNRDINLVKAEIDQYLLNAQMYQGFVDGIFFDEMSSDLADVGYYRELANYVNQQLPTALTFGNPGTYFIENPSGQTAFNAADFANVFDTLMMFENTGAEYLNNYTAPTYLGFRNADGFAHAIHTQANWDASLLALAASRKAGFLYVTDDPFLTAGQNPWDTLSSYWPAFVNDLNQFNAIPEPSAGSAWVAVAVMVGRRNRKRTR